GPRSERECYFALAPHQGREPARPRRVEPALRAALSQDAVQPHWCNCAPERLDPEVVTSHKPLYQAIGSCAQYHCMRCGEPLQPGSNVGHFAQGQLFLTAATTHGPYDYQSGVDAQTHREPNTPLLH